MDCRRLEEESWIHCNDQGQCCKIINESGLNVVNVGNLHSDACDQVVVSIFINKFESGAMDLMGELGF